MSHQKQRERGFTLVEMLVVIAIIGILAAILVPTIGAVVAAGKRGAIITELNQLESALEAYKLANKDYPPDFTNTAAVIAHVQRAYPRAASSIGNLNNFFNTRTGNFPTAGAPPSWPDCKEGPLTTWPETNRLDPAEALVFWLSGLKNNKRNPLLGTGEPKTYFTFKQEQLTDVDQDGWPEYTSPHAQGVPYVYFDGRVQNSASGGAAVSAYAWAVYPSPWSPPSPTMSGPTSPPVRPGAVGRDLNNFPIPPPASQFDFGVIRPYRSNILCFNSSGVPKASFSHTFPGPTESNSLNVTSWMGDRKFQILCAGQDHAFGADQVDTSAMVPIYKTFPNPNFMSADDRDNLATFAEGQSFGDAVP